ncbi:ornithine carbamoyltransferase [Paraoerskovia sediminicola]|uniref:ornithine carbamoyltransferase n=1 Tax=Paraoerskovia sediminicola TaxID=1138587 RepID=UPI002572E19C|nr:ornithine carbamoyltransferase [Paraoerskovia sediminicola]
MPQSLVRLTDWSPDDVARVFERARTVRARPAENRALAGRSVALFFPSTSVRTRVTFERAVHLAGGQPILFPPETLDKPEDLADVGAYLALWVDAVVVRHPRIAVLDRLTTAVPVVNAMTDVNHPCEVLSDLFALSVRREDWRALRYVFVGANENIGRAWSEAAQVLGLDLTQSCPRGHEIPGLRVEPDLIAALRDADVVLTDAVGHLDGAFADYRITRESLAAAAPGVLVNPCPPFTRGAEVTVEVFDSSAFVGHAFKEPLVAVQRAILELVTAR